MSKIRKFRADVKWEGLLGFFRSEYSRSSLEVVLLFWSPFRFDSYRLFTYSEKSKKGIKKWFPTGRFGIMESILCLQSPSFLFPRPRRLREAKKAMAVADPDLELRGRPVFIYLPCWRLFTLRSYLFLPKISGEGNLVPVGGKFGGRAPRPLP